MIFMEDGIVFQWAGLETLGRGQDLCSTTSPVIKTLPRCLCKGKVQKAIRIKGLRGKGREKQEKAGRSMEGQGTAGKAGSARGA